MGESKRVKYYDIARALCMLWIVGVWHMFSGYIGYEGIVYNTICRNITGGVLSTFFYMSGKLTSMKEANTYIESAKIVSNKIIKFYPLYFLSAVSLYFISYYSSTGMLIENILCVGMFTGRMVGTIWFAEIVIILYITSAFFIKKKKVSTNVMFVFVVVFLLWVEKRFVGIFDSRLLNALIWYYIGLLMPKKVEQRVISKKTVCLFSLTVFFVLTLLCYTEFPIYEYFYEFAFIVAVLGLSYFISENLTIYRLVYPVSVASTMCYLFHRQYFAVWRHFFKPYPILFAYLIILPSLIVIGYYAQKTYDVFVSKIMRAK